MCGINLAAHALRRREIAYNYAYASVDDNQAFAKLGAITAAPQWHARRLRNAKLGVVGEHPAGLDTCDLDAPGLKARLGVHVESLSLGEVFERVRALDREVIHPVRESLETRLPNLGELEQAPLNGTLGAYVVLRELAKNKGLDGIAVRCWPEFFTDLGCAACGALSMLTDNGIPSSCEADANGTLTQMILGWLSGAPAFGTDIVSVDVEHDHFVVWHCGLAPLSMADPNSPTAGDHPLQPGITAADGVPAQTRDGYRRAVEPGQRRAAPGGRGWRDAPGADEFHRNIGRVAFRQTRRSNPGYNPQRGAGAPCSLDLRKSYASFARAGAHAGNSRSPPVRANNHQE